MPKMAPVLLALALRAWRLRAPRTARAHGAKQFWRWPVRMSAWLATRYSSTTRVILSAESSTSRACRCAGRGGAAVAEPCAPLEAPSLTSASFYPLQHARGPPHGFRLAEQPQHRRPRHPRLGGHVGQHAADRRAFLRFHEPHLLPRRMPRQRCVAIVVRALRAARRAPHARALGGLDGLFHERSLADALRPGIMVILPLPWDWLLYSTNASTQATMIANMRTIVRLHAAHPAVLAWVRHFAAPCAGRSASGPF